MIPRPAGPADAAAIARVEQIAADTPWSLDAVRGMLEAPSTAAWVVGDPVVGHLLTACAAEEAEILNLAVDPAHRRSGYARALLQAAEQNWVARDVRAAWLEVRVDNTPARRLYASRGWVPAGTRRRYYADGTDAQVMRWSPS